MKIKEKRHSLQLGVLLILVLLGVAVYMFYMAFQEQIPYWISDYRSKNVQSMYTNFQGLGTDDSDGLTKNPDSENAINEEAEEQVIGEQRSEKNIQKPQNWNGVDWKGLKKMNPDIIGWIRIPDLAVDYAILKGTKDDYYLNHHMDGTENILGSIFASNGTSHSLNDAHTILYGHNMASGRMFGQLSFYTDVDFWKKHPYVYIYTPDRTLTCAIYNVYNCLDNDFTYTLGYTLESEDYKKWIKETEKKGLYKTEFVPTGNEQIFTLSTCADYGTKNNRFVANCMVIREENKVEPIVR